VTIRKPGRAQNWRKQSIRKDEHNEGKIGKVKKKAKKNSFSTGQKKASRVSGCQVEATIQKGLVGFIAKRGGQRKTSGC